MFEVKTLTSAPEEARPGLEQLQKAFGFLPNIAGVIANSPILMNAFVGVFAQVHSSSFTEAEIQALLLTNAVTNASPWAVAFHSTLSLQQGVSAADVDAMRQGKVPGEPRLAALSRLTRTLIESRGHASEDDLKRFEDAGFSRQQVLEVITVNAASLITNYTGSVTQTPLEDTFQAQRWQPHA